ncbi:transposase family protein [Streptomyces sp. NPDC048362]|uniref:transposase family protein n=1 Tax=Streptomyces sp. NPDC048362 TaxID=3365539 RepID=UPI003712305D
MPAFVLSRSALPAGDAVEAVDPRARRGRRYPLVALVRAAACAVAAGAHSYAAIGHWLRRAPQDALARLGFSARGVLRVRPAASMDTVRWVIERLHPEAWLCCCSLPVRSASDLGGWRRTGRVPGDHARGRGPLASRKISAAH